MNKLAAIVFGFALAMGINAAWSATVTHGSDLASGDIGPALLDPADSQIRYSHQRPTTLITTNTVTFVGGDAVDLSGDLGGSGTLKTDLPIIMSSSGTLTQSGTVTNTTTSTITPTTTVTATGTGTGTQTTSIAATYGYTSAPIPGGTVTRTTTHSFTATGTVTATTTATATATRTAPTTATSTGTASTTVSGTASATGTGTGTRTATGTGTNTATVAITATETATTTGTQTYTRTATSTGSKTVTETRSVSYSLTASATGSATFTAVSATGTISGTMTNTHTETQANTSTAIGTQTLTGTATNTAIGKMSDNLGLSLKFPGTTGQILKRDASGNLIPSALTDEGSSVSATGSIYAPNGVVQGFALRAGVQSGAIGQIDMYAGESGFKLSIYAPYPMTGDRGFELPANDGVAGDCLHTDGSGTWYFATCPSGSGGTITGSGTAGTLAKWASASSLNNATSTDVINTLGYTPVPTGRLVCGQALTADVSCNYTPDNNSVTAQGTPVAATFDNRGRATGFQSITPSWIGAVAVADLVTQYQDGPGSDVGTGGDTNYHTIISYTVTVPSGTHYLTINAKASVFGGNNTCTAGIFIDSYSSLVGTISDAYGGNTYWKHTISATGRATVTGGTDHTIYLGIKSDSAANPCTASANRASLTFTMTAN